ncbi:MAG TPA: hypothetical protein VKA85_01555 [Candidatus Limnocylindrales bacterium]|nr:hypothetical protein [Candidatus Limnocylindrales bacterium]
MDPGLEQLMATEQYSVDAPTKDAALVAGMNQLTAHHRAHCPEYARIVEAAYPGGSEAARLADVPYLPVSLFKSLDLKSVADRDVFKVMTSSGTTSHVPSRIALDVETARLQTRALSTIVTHYLGRSRLPMLILDHPDVVRDRHSFSARGAGILGMLSFGRDHLYALDPDMAVDRAAVRGWLERHAGDDLLLFGFTFMAWEYFFEPLAGDGIDLSRATLIHTGGWKKLADRAISTNAFRSRLAGDFDLTRIHNFYGMVEQVGSVFFECPAGHFHPPNFADVIVRDPRSWEPSATGDAGVVEVMSLLPRSYPGHAILTEDVGVVDGIDDCPCGRKGKRFHVIGRVPKAEIRGCSDTHERAA